MKLYDFNEMNPQGVQRKILDVIFCIRILCETILFVVIISFMNAAESRFSFFRAEVAVEEEPFSVEYSN